MKSFLPALDLLDRTHDFPGPYLFKIIGKPDQGFLARVIAVVREELTSEVDPPYHVREAVGGRHVSVTVEPIVQSAQQVVAIYRRLGAIDGLVMMF
jgi:putative lipoic acid-binding regulatory protein